LDGNGPFNENESSYEDHDKCRKATKGRQETPFQYKHSIQIVHICGEIYQNCGVKEDESSKETGSYSWIKCRSEAV